MTTDCAVAGGTSHDELPTNGFGSILHNATSESRALWWKCFSTKAFSIVHNDKIESCLLLPKSDADPVAVRVFDRVENGLLGNEVQLGRLSCCDFLASPALN